MSEKLLKVGQRIEVKEKNIRGTIQYIGLTSFATGRWVGVELDEPKGKNNGSIKGSSYFQCAENHGMFIRESQCIFLDSAGNPIPESPEERQTRSRLSSVRRKSPIKVSAKRQTMTPSTSSSRLSLSGSRQSLSGSRTQLSMSISEKSEIPKPSKSLMGPPEQFQAAKRASFVETGFLETLRPQFTPGQSMTSQAPTPQPSTEDKLHNMQVLQENDELRKQVQDLTEKLETLKIRRGEDKERLREFDKIKTQCETLQEFKSKIMDAQSSLQRELQRAKQEAKDAIEARDIHQEEMSELAENVELITLDKEMAEEKADTLALELESAKERIEELQLDLELLKAEMQEKSFIKTDGSSGGEPQAVATGMTVYEFKQLEQQNARLKETLVRMRDLSAHEKHEIQKLNKELELKKSEVMELQRIKEKLTTRVDELEGQFVDLQEQVDAALGAEEMVEQLADKKMELEDRVKSLEEEIAELEALEEVHEQLVEQNHELELDLREELDLAHSAKREALREKDAALETVLDRDQTILKFRELVQRLNDQATDLRDKVNQESSGRDLTETIDFKQVFAESKAHTRAIDLQLRQIELTQSNEHVKYLLAYMPEVFMSRGGDHDAILVILLVSRIVFKAGIIVAQTRDRFAPVTLIDRNAIMQGHAVHQFAFRSRLLHHIHNLQTVMHQFLYGLSSCSPDVLLRVGASLPEMIAQEKIIDSIVDLLKNHQLDENSSSEGLEKCVNFFNAMYSVLLASEGLTNETQIVRDCMSSISTACESIETDAAIVRGLIIGGDETSESGLLLQFIIQTSENIKQQMKLIKRRLPQDITITKCNLSANTLQNLRQTADHLSRLLNLMFQSAKHVIAFVTSDAVDATSVVSITHGKLWELMSQLCERVYEQDDRGVTQNIKNVLTTANTDMSQLAQYLLDHEYEIMSGVEKEKVHPPISVRAHMVKKQLEETKTLTATLENKEAEIRQLKMNAKLKQSELSEMQIRKDLAEKKLSVLQVDHETNSVRLQKELDELKETFAKKEKEFEETLDHLQSDIEGLENDRGMLRDKLKGFSKKGDLKTTTALDISASSPYIAQELILLKKALNDEREERMKLQAKELEKTLKSLKPLHVPKVKDTRLNELDDELRRVKYDMVMSLVKGSEVPTANTKHANFTKLIQDHKNRQQKIRNEIINKAEMIASEVVQEYLERKPHRSTLGFAKFPTNDLVRQMN